MEEIWKDVVGYEGLYQVSDRGNVKSVARRVVHPYGTRSVAEKVLNPAILKIGYYQVALCRDNKMRSLVIHRLVAESFIPNPENKREVNHIDGNKLNNLVSNLAWVTPSENMIHACSSGLNNSFKARRKVVQMEMNGVEIKTWGSFAEIERALRISRGNVWGCCVGRKNMAGKFKWSYA